MNDLPRHAGPDLRDLFALFDAVDEMPEVEWVVADEVPPPYDRLLVHPHHMTVTVEAHHGDLVDVHILERKQGDDWYARKILLELQKSRKVVQFGMVRVTLPYCGPEVQARILEGKTPLGRILIEHDVLRRIEPTAFVRVLPGPWTEKYFGATRAATYGRLALIHCDGRPAIELLEVVAPSEESTKYEGQRTK
jgi:chorismate-pyruvate lyase